MAAGRRYDAVVVFDEVDRVINSAADARARVVIISEKRASASAVA